MAGFTVIISENKLPDKLFNDQVKTEGFIDRSIRHDNLEIRQHTNAKFSAEKNVGVPPPRCISLIIGVSGNTSQYSFHSLSKASI